MMRTAPQPGAAPQQIGKYKIVRELGRGGMGAVYLGEHELLGSLVAIKVLLPAVSSRETVVQRFFGEAKAATRVRDPGIVQIFDYGYQPDGTAYIVLEYLEGETLSARLKRMMRLPLKDALRIARYLAQSLAAVHNAGIVHRDLKPGNVILVKDPLVEGRERPKILDFGIAKLSRDPEAVGMTNTDVVIGTPLYMAPEQWRGAKHVDGRADIYSLGCILYHLLTGAPPFGGNSIGEICAGHLTEQHMPSSRRVTGLSEEIDQLLDACMAKDRDDRLSSMTALAHGLSQIEQDKPLPAVCRPKPRPVQPAPMASRAPAGPAVALSAVRESTTLSSSSSPSPARSDGGARAWLIAAGVLAIAVGAAGGALTMMRRPAPPPIQSSIADRTAELNRNIAMALKQAEPSKQVAPGTVEIRITSSPPGAEVAVWVSDHGFEPEPLDERTPMTYRVARSDKELRFWLTLKGYENKSVSVPRTQSAFIHVDLEPIAAADHGGPRLRAPAPLPRAPVPAPNKNRALYER